MATITVHMPETVYAELEALAVERSSDPVSVLTDLVMTARHRPTYGQLWRELVDLVQREGGLNVGKTTEEIVEQLRKTREEIFEAEYAHLYR
jgi:protein-arginine kinase